ncbi:putative secreted protein [Streptomyces davaonensis JCM 4913]|uniref:Putative secreted protein n=1 Tax=Streptomyces davaonensis (strain DSM 101723 / JCM 4913 / KCC S-0913 / 768) TaxID=1214101 RepID=K4QWJ3_STRDJ|nr:putative secreted protein [Streptomyces davaonensis JCM 4913]
MLATTSSPAPHAARRLRTAAPSSGSLAMVARGPCRSQGAEVGADPGAQTHGDARRGEAPPRGEGDRRAGLFEVLMATRLISTAERSTDKQRLSTLPQHHATPGAVDSSAHPTRQPGHRPAHQPPRQPKGPPTPSTDAHERSRLENPLVSLGLSVRLGLAGGFVAAEQSSADVLDIRTRDSAPRIDIDQRGSPWLFRMPLSFMTESTVLPPSCGAISVATGRRPPPTSAMLESAAGPGHQLERAHRPPRNGKQHLERPGRHPCRQSPVPAVGHPGQGALRGVWSSKRGGAHAPW